MTVILAEPKLAYFSVPKCGSTSIKRALFEYENGFAFPNYRANGELKHIHNAAYPFRSVAEFDIAKFEGWHKLALVRDPVSRLASCYANRVLHHRDLDTVAIPPEMAARGVIQRPDFDTFVAHLSDYRTLSWLVKHHCEPLTEWLGRDPTLFSRLYALNEINTFLDDLEGILGQPPGTVEHFKKSRSRKIMAEISDETEARIHAFYAEEIEIFGRFF